MLINRYLPFFVVILFSHKTLSQVSKFVSPEGLAVSKANAIFASNLYQATKDAFPKSNFVLSPLSLGNVLGMLRAGANGTTGDEIHTTMGFKDLNETSVYKGFSDIIHSLHENKETFVKSTNRIYITDRVVVKPDFKTTLKDKFYTEIVPANFTLNFDVANNMNKWIEESTNGKITNVISADSIESDTVAIVASAIYFRGKWKDTFEPRVTSSKPFYSDNGISTSAMFMEQENDLPHIELSEISASAISIPYEGERFSLIVILPNDKVSLSEVEKKIQKGVVSLVDFPSRMSMKYVRLTFPKFRMESDTDFIKSGILNKIGIKSMLTPGNADFSRITPEFKIHIDAVIQKCYIDITEWGTEAAGITYAKAVPLSLRRSIPFVVTKPFIAYIYDKDTKTVLFIFRKSTV